MQGIPGKAPGIFLDDFLDSSHRLTVERREKENFRWTLERLVEGRVGWPARLHFEYFDIEGGSIVTRSEL
jgi:hypothetical protein